MTGNRLMHTHTYKHTFLCMHACSHYWVNSIVLQVAVPTEINLSELDGSLVSMATGGVFTAYLTSMLS